MSKLPLEPLGDARWSRIERTLFRKVREGAATVAKRPSRARFVRVAVLAAAVVATGAAAAAIAVSLRSAPAVTAAAPPIARVVTEASPSHLVLAEAALDVAPQSSVEVQDEPRRTVVILERGEVALRVAPRPADRPLVVEAGDVRIRVVGTEFSVRREAEGASVRVVHGAVEVRARGEVAQVVAGGVWPDTRAAAAAGGASGGRGASETGDGDERASATSARGMRAPDVTAGAATGSSGGGSSAGGNGASRSAREAPHGPSLTASATTEQAQFEAAARLERSDPATALARYAALARGSGAWSANALYAAGRLEADRHERGDARRLLADYLRRFPDGPNAEDARALLEALR